MVATFDAAADLVRQLSPVQRARLIDAQRGDEVSRLWLAPWRIMEAPDSWQRSALTGLVRGEQNTILLCSRGAGKSETISSACYLEACLGGFAVVFSRSDRQAMEEIFDKVLRYHRQLGLVQAERPPTMHDLRLKNSGRVLSLPCSEDTVVGKHKVSLLVIDEAAKVPDSFYARVTPMMATTKKLTGVEPRLVLLSTPFGERGFFWREWTGQGRKQWNRVGPITWRDCPRITKEFVDSEAQANGDWYREQEFETKFLSSIGSFFNVSEVLGNVDDNLEVTY